MEKATCEIWKPVVGWEQYYEVSNLGNVRSLPRKMHNYIKPGRILKPQDNGHSYLNVGLHAPDKKDKHAYVHILVANAFIPNPNNLREVNHKDFNKQNNNVENLEWVTSTENKLHYMKSKRAKANLAQRTEKQYNKWVKKVLLHKDSIIKLYQKGKTIIDIQNELDLSRDFITDVIDLYKDYIM
jgi:hypothetical protein